MCASNHEKTARDSRSYCILVCLPCCLSLCPLAPPRCVICASVVRSSLARSLALVFSLSLSLSRARSLALFRSLSLSLSLLLF